MISKAPARSIQHFQWALEEQLRATERNWLGWASEKSNKKSALVHIQEMTTIDSVDISTSGLDLQPWADQMCQKQMA
jgi:hypothetical protein